MGSESIAHQAKGPMGYWLRGHKGETNSIALVKSNYSAVGQKYRDSAVIPPWFRRDSAAILFWFSKPLHFATIGL